MTDNVLTKIVAARQKLIEAEEYHKKVCDEFSASQHRLDDARINWEKILYEFDNKYRVE